jgi:pheromone shutdown-related protein TraB
VRDYGDDVHVLQVGDREFVLVGTAHVSQESTDLVKRVIEEEKPDVVCVELDEQRYKALRDRNRWESLDIKQIIRNKQFPTLVANLMLSSYQKRLGGKLGVMPGAELLAATEVATERGIPFELCDRNIRTTMLRAWRSMSFWKKNNLMAAMLAATFAGEELSEEDLRKLKQKDVLSEMMNELAEAMPQLKRVLIDERDTYLAQKILASEGKRIVAVVGAGHVEGMKKILEAAEPEDLAPIEHVPQPRFSVLKVIGWGIPIVIVVALAWIFATKGSEVGGDNLMFWILANGIPCCIAAILALAHPATIVIAFVAAPITSLIPVIGAGYVTAFVQAWVAPPKVADFQTVADDAGHFTAWWRNRLLKVVLAFFLPSIGSIIGTWVGGLEIVRNAF